MTQSSIAGLTCLLCCVLLSAGALSPPQNLSVEFLDFRGEVTWSPGPGNPPNTTYTVELQPMGRDKWSQKYSCTDIRSTICTLIFNLTEDDLIASYFIRVKASWKGDNSTWTELDSVQPYGETLLSAPTLDISVHERDILVHIRMPQSVLTLLPQLQFRIQVFESDCNNHERKNLDTIFYKDTRSASYDKVSQCMETLETGQTSLSCKDLTLGQCYCVSASAIHKQQQNKPHYESEECVELPGNTSDMVKHVIMAIILLMAVTAILIITPICCYLKSGESEHMPNTLDIGRAERTVMATPGESPTFLASLCIPSSSSGSNVNFLVGELPSSSGYEGRETWFCPVQSSNSPLCLVDDQPLDGQLPPLLPSSFSGALDEDEDGCRTSEEETIATHPLLQDLQEEGAWQLHGATLCQDVPISSLSVCLNCEQEGSGSIDNEGAELQVEVEPVSQTDSSGYLSSALGALEEPQFLNEPSPTYSSGYMSRPDPLTYLT
ncbi:hypothetical protein JZ751_022737 [Albula glossodonta]|uniref:Fibronectin type-III domain-containing protein n=1 Tax=Albula glossodonta TaxID=121402 RepID=A0A8T2PN16_9TELE|nr:hypothetical protein JZ751_022737 [Albula glossodonta]